MNRIGFSTGALARGDFRQAMKMLDNKRVNAIELSALRASELPELLDAFSSLDLSKYCYVALHAPTDAEDEAELVQQLKRLVERHRDVRVVVHPDAVRNLHLWTALHSNVCVENMDSRKSLGQTAAELRSVFEELPNAMLCLDLGHARQVDPTMIESTLLLREFRNRLAHLHISEVDSDGVHHALSRSAVDDFRDVADLIDEDVPVILESCVSEAAIEQEVEAALRSLRRDSNGL